MGTSVIINGLNGELGRVSSAINTSTINEKSGHIRKLLTTLEAHQSIEHGINANESLSQEGKAQALAKLGTNETAPGFKWLKTVVTRLQDIDGRYRDQFFTVDSGIKEAAERLPIFVYLWSKLDALDPSERITQFCQASEQDQVKVLAAMLENPLGPMINEEVKERALTERAKRLTPRDYENYQQNQLVLEFLLMARDWIARWLALEVRVDLSVIRTNLGDEIADALSVAA
jgi:hypothetical protein